MTRVSCPECGYDLNVGKIEDGAQATAVCDNCSAELLVAIEDGEIKTRNTRDYSDSSDEELEY